MPRKKLIRDTTHPYHVTARTNNREWYYLPMPALWEVFSHYCMEITESYDARIHALVVMSNHFHLLISTPQGNLDEMMNQFLREISKSINRSIGRINHVFGGPYKWSLIGGPFYYQHALKYVYRNPVKAKIAQVVEEYPFSTLQHLLKSPPLPFPIHPSVFDDSGILSLPPNAQLSWFNLNYTEKEDECVRRALRRRQFQITADPKTRKVPWIFEEPL